MYDFILYRLIIRLRRAPCPGNSKYSLNRITSNYIKWFHIKDAAEKKCFICINCTLYLDLWNSMVTVMESLLFGDINGLTKSWSCFISIIFTCICQNAHTSFISKLNSHYIHAIKACKMIKNEMVIQITKDLVQTNPLNKQLIVLLFWGAKSENQCVC